MYKTKTVFQEKVRILDHRLLLCFSREKSYLERLVMDKCWSHGMKARRSFYRPFGLRDKGGKLA